MERSEIFRISAMSAILLALSACSIIPYEPGTRANEAAQRATIGATRATERVEYKDLPKGVFIGIAMSGGGSRAANFSAAVLRELESRGILKHAAAISSVSGSSLTAAYYGRFGNDTNHWNDRELKERLRYDFRGDWLVRWIYPHHVVRYWFTSFDRSDIMKSVFDDVLFEGRRATFADMNTGISTPKILINATALTGENFVFTDENFEAIGSRLDTYPLSHAIMASAAFPAAFNSVTLQDYEKTKERKEKVYKHLYDGGPSDNLGVVALKRVLYRLGTETSQLRGCLLILVDAYPYSKSKETQNEADPDPRKLFDFILDDNWKDAFDDLLSSQRRQALLAMGYPHDKKVGEEKLWEFRPFRAQAGSNDRNVSCHVWHVTHEQLVLARTDKEARDIQNVAGAVREIATDFRLGNPFLGNAQEFQDALYAQANWLVERGAPKVLQLIKEWGLSD